MHNVKYATVNSTIVTFASDQERHFALVPRWHISSNCYFSSPALRSSLLVRMRTALHSINSLPLSVNALRSAIAATMRANEMYFRRKPRSLSHIRGLRKCKMAAPNRPHHHATPLLSVYSAPISELTTTHVTHSRENSTM